MIDSFDTIFNEVIKQLKNGIPIYKTLKILKVDRVAFYKQITPLQKSELDLNRIATKKQSYKGNSRRPGYTKLFEADYLFKDNEL